MQATTDLRDEHVTVLRMLDVLRLLGRRARAGEEPADAADLAECVDFLRVFVDECHHAKEEQLLFPAMRSSAGLDETEAHMIVRLLAEHAAAREEVSRIAEGQDLGRTIEVYEAIMRPHIMLEDNECFDLADRRLPPQIQKRLAEGYARIDSETIGGGRGEAYRALLLRLEEKYAPVTGR